ncbi:MAG TPA: zinc-dependent metalloprotease family protein [Candidatus Saccharimonadales bacterium]|nr:zinc-dependent metalloprotease family protein [Candidatus Saccharimonadales bacterium]
MSKAVREFTVFYEADGPYAVSKDYAQSIMGGAASIVSKYTGHIAMGPAKGFRLRAATNPLPNKPLSLGSDYDHAAIITGRHVGVSEGQPVPGIAHVDDAQIAIYKFSTVEDPTGTHTMHAAVHEMGHSFGLKHCIGRLCCMNGEYSLEPSKVNPYIESGRPFCDPHAEELEIAGFTALAKRL